MAYRRRRYKKRTRRGRRTRARRSYRRVARAVRREILKKTETKKYDFSVENRNVYHNVGPSGGGVGPYISPVTDTTFFNCWRLISQGVGTNNRIGDSIIPRGMSLRLWLSNKHDRPNVTYRVVIGILPKINQDNVITSATNCQWQVVYTNALLGRTNKDLGVKILYERYIRNITPWGYINGPTQTKECSRYKKIWIKRKRARPIVYNDTTQVIVNKPVFLCVVPYDVYGTLITDNLGSYAYQCTLYFKDP